MIDAPVWYFDAKYEAKDKVKNLSIDCYRVEVMRGYGGKWCVSVDGNKFLRTDGTVK